LWTPLRIAAQVRVAIVGAGVAGLAAAHRLDPHCDVVLYEAEPRAGGHAHTVLAGGHALDSGFVVCNERNYPTFLALMQELGIALRPSIMSFSVRCERCDLEFSGHGLRGLFAQRRNLVRPSFARLLLDLGRFFRNARSMLDDPEGDHLTIGEFLERGRYGRSLSDHFLAPMGAAIWSSSPARMREMPARFFVRFFDNHGLLGVRDAPLWYTIEGGSERYVHALCARLRGRVALAAPVRSVRRDDAAVEVTAAGGAPERFDRVILACHPGQALVLLADPSDDERDALSRMPYTSNETVMHRGDSLLPRRVAARAAWNVALDDCRGRDRPVAVTYSLNRLHALSDPAEYCVSLNQSSRIDERDVIARMTYEHPVYTLDSVAARERLRSQLGSRRTDYAGAYLGWGFHEDGAVSGVAAAERTLAGAS
jgi:predicted NAD/FAD-binding protein